MQIKMSTKGYDILKSGSVILYDGDSDLKMDMSFDNGFSFSIVFKFITEKTKGQNLNKDVDGNVITFKCINFNNSLGTGTVKPISIATIDGKEMFLHFWVYALDNQDGRKLEYTFLQEA